MLRRRGDGGAGLELVLERLQRAAAERAGGAEELATLFVALLRATGCLVRCARCLRSCIHVKTTFL